MKNNRFFAFLFTALLAAALTLMPIPAAATGGFSAGGTAPASDPVPGSAAGQPVGSADAPNAADYDTAPSNGTPSGRNSGGTASDDVSGSLTSGNTATDRTSGNTTSGNTMSGRTTSGGTTSGGTATDRTTSGSTASNTAGNTSAGSAYASGVPTAAAERHLLTLVPLLAAAGLLFAGSLRARTRRTARRGMQLF